MLIDKISAEEFEIINLLRHRAAEDTEFSSGNMVSDEQWLCYWESEKATFGLDEPFKDSLILKKEIVSTVPDSELYDKMYEVVSFIEPMREKIINHLSQYQDTRAYVYGRSRESLRFIFDSYVFTADAFINNIFDFDTIEFKISEDTTFKMNRGCKIMKTLGKLARLVGYETPFEECRLRQSRIMNDARIKATLCLSIHPIDYMTASLNSNNWRSCMNWDDGEYRRGVIEMMNSPYVVVAYLESKSEHLRITRDLQWNSKKWREFFIVHPNIISAIKGYPYWNRELEDTVLNWLRELYNTDGRNYSSKISHWQVDNRIIEKDDDIDARINFECGPAMYNDFYDNNVYHSILRVGLHDYYGIDYSGASECVICGHYEVDFDNEGDVCCSDCLEKYYCCSCGERISYRGDLVIFEDRYYCRYCYDELPTCTFCDEAVDLDNDGDADQFVIAIRNKDDVDDVVYDYGSPYQVVCCADCAESIYRIPKFRDLMRNRYHFHQWHRYNVAYLDELTPAAQECCLFDNYEEHLRPLQDTSPVYTNPW